MTRPLNFLHLTTFYPPFSFGGDALQVYRLSHALADSGHHVDLIHVLILTTCSTLKIHL